MRAKAILVGLLLLSGCAFPQEVRRLGVSYNNAVADLGDQLTLVNIERAEEGLPLHYTSFSRLSGSLTFTGSGSVNGALHADGATDTNTTATTASATPGVVTTVARAVTSGGNVYTPNLMASVSTGPTFDVNVLDTQEFYQGILKEIPFGTVNAFLSEGYSDDLLIHLLIHRIDYVQVIDPNDHSKDRLLASFVNEPGRTSVHPEQFDKLVDCLSLRGVAATPRRLVPLSRVTTDTKGQPIPLKVDDLAKIDGKVLDISDQITGSNAADASIYLQRPASSDRQAAMDYAPSEQCASTFEAQPKLAEPTSMRAQADNDGASSTGTIDRNELKLVRDLTGDGTIPVPQQGPAALVAAAAGPAIVRYVTFRSPEGVMKYLGEYLRVYHATATHAGVPKVGGRYIFATAKNTPPAGGAIVARVGAATYSISNDQTDDGLFQYRRNLDVLALVQALINLQKKSDDRLTTVPVQLVR